LPYPYEGSTGYVTGSFSIKTYNDRLCVYDNGTTVCDKGHKIRTDSYCSSQGIGTYNSTDPTFQPAYTICTTNYSSNGDYVVSLCSKGVTSANQDLVSAGNREDTIREVQRSIYKSKTDFIYVKSPTMSPFDCYISACSNEISHTYSEFIDTIYVSGYHKIIQHDSGFILRGDGITSDFFSLDINGVVSIVAPVLFFPKVVAYTSISVEGVFYGYYNQVVDDDVYYTSNPSFDSHHELNDNPVEICVGDLTPPSLENILPASGTHLLPVNTGISFDIVDAIGGIDLSTITLTVSGSLTYQTGGYTLISSGVEQVPYVSLTGDKNRYSIEYAPPITWGSNETVLVNVYGYDITQEFLCPGHTRNYFNYLYEFFINNTNDLSATITVVADTDSPYLRNQIPTPFTTYADSGSNISFDIVDDTTGIDVESLDIYINNIKVVSGGVSQLSAGEISITNYGNYYTFIYGNPSSFTYNSRMIIRVVVDDNYTPAPNHTDYTYYFDVVQSSTLEIENFTPTVGVTRDLESVDISVYIHDGIYDVDQINLYLSINGDLCPAIYTPTYGIRNLTSTVSGVYTLDSISVYNTSVENTHLTDISISYPYFTGGAITGGSCSGGLSGDFPNPFANTTDTYLVSGDITSGISISGTIGTVLVSGVNWDGKTVGSTVSNVDLTGYYSTYISMGNVSISGTTGAILEYHPPNNFNYGEPIDVLVHAENKSSTAKVIREQIYRLLYGYDIKVFNRRFTPKTKVDVAIRAFNSEDFRNYLYSGFYFTTQDRSHKDLTASINCVTPWVDITGIIYPQAPVHKYGKLMTVSIYAKDLAGNEMGPYVFNYTIEEEP
jgi:hypothetical protein